jgi:hypothetical protein
MWFDEEIAEPAADVVEVADDSESEALKLWSDIEELTQPFDSEPHDAWWEAHQN